MSKELSVLFIEDSADDAEILLLELNKGGIEPEWERVDTAESLKRALSKQEWDIIISDYAMPGFTGLDALNIVKQQKLVTPFIIVSGTIGEETAVAAMKTGASDYIMKARLARLVPAVERELKEAENRKRSEEVLAAANKNLELLGETVNTMNECVSITDNAHKYIFVNTAFENTYGYKEEELIGKTSRIIQVEGQSELINEIRQKTKLRGWKGELLNKKKDGTIFPIELSVTPLRDVNGKIVAHIGISTDITERKKFITDLMEREEKYRTLTYNLNVGVYRSTPGKNGMFIEANPAFVKIFGFRSKSELERWKVVDLYPDPLERNNIEKKLASKGFILNEEIKLRKKDGTIFVASLSTTTAKDESGKIIHYDGIIEDITERKAIDEQLIESHDRYESIFDGAADGIIYSDRKGKILSVNSAFTKLIGIKKADLIGKYGIQLAKQLLPKKAMLKNLKFFTKILKGKAINKFPIEFNNRILEYYTPEQKGKPGVTIMARDVTEENKTRDKIELHQKNLQTLSNELTMAEEKAKRRLATMLHDKLGQALVLANFKASELNKKTTDSEHRKMLNEISSFIEDAITESRNITYELSPAILYEMGLIPAIGLKLDDIEKSNKIKTLLIDQSKSHELEEKVQIILFRTISELLQNVIKHSKAKNVNVSFRRANGIYRIIVSDNGIGFDFEAMRAKALLEKKFGLFSIMERIRYIGGEVNIDAAPKEGTKVVIDLPIK